MTLTLEQSIGWRPELQGWSRDILPFYDTMAAYLPDEAVVIEVGVYQGRSLIYLMLKLRELGKAATVWGIDAPDMPLGWRLELAKNLDEHKCHPFVSNRGSLDAAKWMADGYADLVFIDADHSYEAVRADIAAWLPKVKPGGMLAGHDYCAQFDGVRRAVDEAFDGRVVVEDTVWQVRV